MELLPFLLLATLFTSIVVAYFWYIDMSFSYTDLGRRFRYQRKLPDALEYENRGSGYFRTPTIRTVAMIPYYEGDPQRRVYDARKHEVIYEAKD